jgi:hypothetical protein
MNYIEITAGSVGISIFCVYIYKLRQLHLKSKCNKIIELEIDIERNESN